MATDGLDTGDFQLPEVQVLDVLVLDVYLILDVLDTRRTWYLTYLVLDVLGT